MSMQKLVKELYKCCPMPEKAGMALVLYDTGSMFLAIGKDADRLYLTLGWELSDFADEGSIYSYMTVSTVGVKVLQQLGIEYQSSRYRYRMILMARALRLLNRL